MATFSALIALAFIALCQSYPAEDYVMQKVMTYEYEIDDYNGNEQSKKETMAGETTRGEYKTRMPDGKLQVVTYESGPFGHLANVKYEEQGEEVGDSATHAPHVTTPVAANATTPDQPENTKYYPEGPYVDVKQIVNYEYEINDYGGNEQSKKETIDGDSAIGEYKTRMPDGQLQVVTYESGPDGHRADVKYEPAPATTTTTTTTTPATTTTTTEHHYASEAPVYGSGPAKKAPLYSTPKPYVRTSTNVKYVKVPRPSFYPYPAIYAGPYSPHPYRPLHQATYQPTPTYKSPSIAPYGQPFHPDYIPAPSYGSSY